MSEVRQGEVVGSDGVLPVRVSKWAHGTFVDQSDELAVEEPLEIRVADHVATTTMRTPGHDRELAVGFLLTDGWISTLGDLSSVSECRPLEGELRSNTIVAIPRPGHTLVTDPVERGLRARTTNSACGICGRANIDELRTLCQPLTRDFRIEPQTLLDLVAALPQRQSNYTRTGSAHAAGIATSGGHMHHVFEDVGRHNAVDKVIGHSLLAGLKPDVLVVSSRAGFEIVQKACVAQIPVVVSISAATSLAVETARCFDITLVGFARGHSLTVYNDPGRLTNLHD